MRFFTFSGFKNDKQTYYKRYMLSCISKWIRIDYYLEDIYKISVYADT